MRSKAANVRIGPRRVAVLTYDGLSMFEFSVACAVFSPAQGHALGAAPWYDLAVCGDSDSVRLDVGMTLQVPRTLASLRRADTVVLPPCEDATAVSAATLTAIRRAHARGARIVSLCTGAFVLARCGLLDGRRAVTHWSECGVLAAAYPSVTVDPSVLYVDDGDILTSAGSAASIDLCLHVVRLDHGAEVAAGLARQLVSQPHRDGGQAQYIETPMPDLREAKPFTGALRWMSEHLHEPMTVPDVAHRSAMSPRSFARHFVSVTGSTPYQWLLRQRIAFAQRLLEGSDLPIDVVAQRAGLGNATNLRKHFQRQVGTNPSAYRRTFRTPDRDALPAQAMSTTPDTRPTLRPVGSS